MCQCPNRATFISTVSSQSSLKSRLPRLIFACNSQNILKIRLFKLVFGFLKNFLFFIINQIVNLSRGFFNLYQGECEHRHRKKNVYSINCEKLKNKFLTK